MAVERWRAAQGVTVRLRIRFEEDGAVYDPFSISKVEIRDSNGTLQQTALAGWVQDGVGLYHLDYAIPAGAALGGWEDRWYYTPVTGYPPFTASLTFAVFAAGAFDSSTGFLTVAEIKARYLPATTLSDADLEFASRVCSGFFERMAGRAFTTRARTITVDGSGRLDQPLPSDVVVVSLVSITNLDDGSSLAVDDIRWSRSRLFHKDWRPRFRRGSMWTPPHLQCSGGGDPFPLGYRNLQISLMDGEFLAPPDDVMHAVGLMIRNMCMDDTVCAAWILNYAAEGVDGLQVNYRDMDPGSRKKSMTGLPEVDAVANSYHRQVGRVRSLSR